MEKTTFKTEELVERLCRLAFDDSKNSDIKLVELDEDIEKIRKSESLYTDGDKVYAVADGAECKLHISKEQLEMVAA